MNIVDLIYNPLKRSSRILINGKTVSPYSEIANYLLEPFTFWAPKILDALSRELNDDFELKFTSAPIEIAVMQKLAQLNENCKDFSAGEFTIGLNLPERVKVLETLGYRKENKNTYAISILTEDSANFEYVKSAFSSIEGVKVDNNSIMLSYGECMDVLFELHSGTAAESDNYAAKCFVSKDKNAILSWLNSGGKNDLAVLLGESDELCGTQQETFVFECTDLQLAKCLVDFTEYKLIVPCFSKLCSEFITEYDGDKNTGLLKSLDAVEPIISVYCNNTIMEEGTSCSINIEAFPDNVEVPEIIFRISNEGVLRYYNGMLYALKDGNSLVEAYVSGTIEPIYQAEVSVIKRNKITDIQLNNTEYVIGKGDSVEFKYSILPANADNASDIQIVSDNESVVKIESDNTFKGINQGKATVRIFTKEVSREIKVTVKPYATGIVLSSDKIKLLVGGSKELLYNTIPYDVINSQISFEVTDPKIIDYDGKIVKAKSFGYSGITFYNSDRSIKQHCTVEVKSTLTNDKSNPFGAFTIIAFAISLVLSAFAVSASLSVAAIGLILGIVGIPYANSIVKDQFTNFGTEKKPEYMMCIIGLILNLMAIVFQIL